MSKKSWQVKREREERREREEARKQAQAWKGADEDQIAIVDFILNRAHIGQNVLVNTETLHVCTCNTWLEGYKVLTLTKEIKDAFLSNSKEAYALYVDALLNPSIKEESTSVAEKIATPLQIIVKVKDSVKKIYNRSEIMKQAWVFVREFGLDLSVAMQKSWAIAKA